MKKSPLQSLCLAVLMLALIPLQAAAQQGESVCGAVVTDPSVETLMCSEVAYVVEGGPNGDEMLTDYVTGSSSSRYDGADLFDSAPDQLGQPLFAESKVAVSQDGSMVTITNRSGATAGPLDATSQAVTLQSFSRVTVTPMAGGSTDPVEITVSADHAFTIDRPDANGGDGSAGGASSIFVTDKATGFSAGNIQCFAQKSATGAPPFAVADCAAGNINDEGGGKYSVSYQAERKIMVTPGDALILDVRDASLITSEGYNAGDSDWSSDNSGTAVFTVSSSDPSVTFEVAGDPAPQVSINAGFNDAWYNPATDGQGLLIVIYESIPLAFLAWFTYEADAGDGAASSLDAVNDPFSGLQAVLGDDEHRWLTAAGGFEGNTAMMDISVTSGGKFDAGDPVEREVVGTIELTFESCAKGTVKYNIPSINRSGSVPIQRVAGDNIPLCESLNGN